jgi:hypothetical protein
VSGDSLPQNTPDTPAGFGAAGFHHTWRRAARNDPRMKARHLAVLDAYAEHYYAGKDAMRGVGVTDARLAWWTGLGETTIRAARVELRRWGWLGLVRAHGRGVVARYAFLIPELSTPAAVIPKDAGIRRVNAGAPKVKDAGIRRVNAVKTPESGAIPLPSPYLPTSRAHGADPGPSPTDEAGGQTTPTTTPPAPRPPVPATTGQDGTLAGWEAVAAVLPGPVAERARTGRTARQVAQLVAACLAAGWSVEQLRSRLADVENGARNPVSVAVARLRDVQADRPPRPAAPQLSTAQLQRAAGGRECPHGDLDVINPATNLHVCPSCRAAGKATETASTQVRTSKTALEGLADTWRLAQ